MRQDEAKESTPSGAACQRIPEKFAGMTRPMTVEGSRTYTYRTVKDTDLRLHVFLPNDFQPSDKCPAIVFFFGGGWSWGTVEQFVPQAKYLARRGMVAAVADYRVLYRDNSTPFDSVEDAREAIRWMRSHAADLGIDPSRIAASGESAGAHLALSSALIEGPGDGDNQQQQTSAKADALILFSPAIDLADAAIKALVRERFGDLVADRIDAISPFQHVCEGLPPTIILNGKADKTTPYAVAEAYSKRAVASGNECRVVGYEGADHGFSNFAEFPVESSQGGKWYLPTLLETDRFLTSIGYLQGPAPSEISQLP
jgi:acetyl esterase